jgi:hypothetical protein
VLNNLKIFFVLSFIFFGCKISAFNNLSNQLVLKTEVSKNKIFIDSKQHVVQTYLFVKTKMKRKSKATEDFALRLFFQEMQQYTYFTDSHPTKKTKYALSFKSTLQCKRGPPTA